MLSHPLRQTCEMRSPCNPLPCFHSNIHKTRNVHNPSYAFMSTDKGRTVKREMHTSSPMLLYPQRHICEMRNAHDLSHAFTSTKADLRDEICTQPLMFFFVHKGLLTKCTQPSLHFWSHKGRPSRLEMNTASPTLQCPPRDIWNKKCVPYIQGWIIL